MVRNYSIANAKHDRDHGSRAGCRRKSRCFLFVTLWNDEVCDNGNAMKQSKLEVNSRDVIK